jgi:hypothetical protein
MIRQFIVIEPTPMLSLADSISEGFSEPSRLVNGLCAVARTITALHKRAFGYGSVSPLNIVVTDTTFELRPPPLFPFLTINSSPPPIVHRPHYRETTDERFCSLLTASDCLIRDLRTFAKLLCEFGLYGGRQLFGDFQDTSKLQEHFKLPHPAVDLLSNETDNFLDSGFES